MFGAFHRFWNTIRSRCRKPELAARCADCLMMKRVDIEFFASIDGGNNRVAQQIYRMSRLITRSILRMTNERSSVRHLCKTLFNILYNVTTKCNSQCLHTPTNAQHRNLAVISQLGDEQFR